MTSHKIYPKKHFGQHFLHDQNIIAKIIAAINPKEGEHFVEIGPGLGALTTHVLPLVKNIDVIEIDRDVIPQLQANCKDLGDLRIHQQDVLTFDFASLHFPKIRLIGNLPYNISTPLLFHINKKINKIKDMHFMLQKEVAERICAKPGNKIYGRLSVMVQYYCEAELLFTLGPGAFTPPPKVDSAFIKLIPRTKHIPEATNEKLFADVVAQAFSQRRKTIANSLKKFVTLAQLEKLEIDPKLRAEDLSVADFVMISNDCANLHN